MKKRPGTPAVTARLRPIIVGYALEGDGDGRDLIELYQAAGAKLPFFHRGYSIADASVRLKKAADKVGLEVVRDHGEFKLYKK